MTAVFTHKRLNSILASLDEYEGPLNEMCSSKVCWFVIKEYTIVKFDAPKLRMVHIVVFYKGYNIIGFTIMWLH